MRNEHLLQPCPFLLELGPVALGAKERRLVLDEAHRQGLQAHAHRSTLHIHIDGDLLPDQKAVHAALDLFASFAPPDTLLRYGRDQPLYSGTLAGFCQAVRS